MKTYYSMFAKHKPCMCSFCIVNRMADILFWYVFIIPFVFAFLFTVDLFAPERDHLKREQRQAEHVEFLFKEQTGCEREQPKEKEIKDE